MTKFETAVSEKYIPNWDIVYVLKEFLQNAIFAKTILGDDLDIKHDGEYAIIGNYKSGFSKGKLLIGESGQRGIAGAGGTFGEGSAMAMMVAKRLNKHCSLQTNGFTVYPELEPSSIDPDVRILVFHVEDHDLNSGTVATIECTEEELDKAKSHFAILKGISPDITKKVAIIDDAMNSIFVNGVLVSEQPSVLAYNFINENIMNRDRTTVDMNLLKREVRDLVCGLSDQDQICTIIKGIMGDGTTIEAQAGMYYFVYPEAWKAAFERLFGNKVALATGTESDTKARYHGFKTLNSIPHNWHSALSQCDIHPTSSIPECQDKPKMVHRKPTGIHSENLAWAKRLIKMYYSDYGTVKVADQVYDQYGEEVNGLHDYSTDTTWISRHMLDTKESTFKVLLHETAHRRSHASDCTAFFERELEYAAYCILTRGADKR